jgi:hypothetical protein
MISEIKEKIILQYMLLDDTSINPEKYVLEYAS